MKKISELLARMPKKFDPDQTIEQLLEVPAIRVFVMKHDLTHHQIMQSLNVFLTYREQHDQCQACQDLVSCNLPIAGMTPTLAMENGSAILVYVPCQHNQNQARKRAVDALYVPKRVFEADLADMDVLSTKRKEVYRFMIDFLTQYPKSTLQKGLYLSGLYGSGKTYILACLANELAKKDVDVIFAYYPDLVRELKSSIGSSQLSTLIERLKTAPVLFLDDFGAESPSAFIRDEVLGPILQHRLLDCKPTFFSSNLKMKSLIDSLVINDSILEKSKAARIHERIKELTTEFEILEKPIQTT